MWVDRWSNLGLSWTYLDYVECWLLPLGDATVCCVVVLQGHRGYLLPVSPICGFATVTSVVLLWDSTVTGVVPAAKCCGITIVVVGASFLEICGYSHLMVWLLPFVLLNHPNSPCYPSCGPCCPDGLAAALAGCRLLVRALVAMLLLLPTVALAVAIAKSAQPAKIPVTPYIANVTVPV
jgi:hypothetical protein